MYRVAVAASLALFAIASSAGVIEGSCRYDGPIPKPRPIEMTRECKEKHPEPLFPETVVLGENNALANVFVYVKSGLPEGKTYASPKEPLVVDQVGCKYTPHVFAIMAGQPIEVRNSDRIIHNVHGQPRENKAFNFGMTEAIDKMTVNLDQPEFMFPIRCDVHKWMLAWCAVMPHPFFAVTAADGTFRIEGLEPGTYEIEAWHERLGSHTAAVTLDADETESASFTFSLAKKKE